MKTFLILLFCMLSTDAYTQETGKKVFIYRVRSANGSAIKYHLKINKELFDFPNDFQKEFLIKSDSISIQVLNKRFIHTSTVINQKLTEENYFIVYPIEVKVGLKGTDIIVERVCRECYYKYLSFSKKIHSNKNE